MNCPRCLQAVLNEREREGITIDVCASCRGIWLDRGELEKLIARASRDFDDSSPHHAAPQRHDTPPRGVRHDDYHRDPRRKRRWYESFGDIFD
jgi:uncharacterized protein